MPRPSHRQGILLLSLPKTWLDVTQRQEVDDALHIPLGKMFLKHTLVIYQINMFRFGIAYRIGDRAGLAGAMILVIPCFGKRRVFNLPIEIMES